MTTTVQYIVQCSDHTVPKLFDTLSDAKDHIEKQYKSAHKRTDEYRQYHLDLKYEITKQIKLTEHISTVSAHNMTGRGLELAGC